MSTSHEGAGHEGHESTTDARDSDAMAGARDVFRIDGMDCAEEIAVLKREIGPLVGGANNLGFDVLQQKMVVRASATPINPAEIVRAVAVTGMKATPWERPKENAPRVAPRRDARSTAVIASGVATAGGFALHALIAGSAMAALGSEGMGVAQGTPLAAKLAYGVAIAAGLWLVLPKALFALRRLRPDMNLLMTVAVAGAIAIDEWFEAATVTFLFAVSLALESWSVGRARRAVEALSALGAPKARVKRGGGEIEIAAEEVRVGDEVVVRGGERFAVDGEVIEGNSDVNQAPITGESAPVPKAPGSEVFAASINGDGALVIRATKIAGESMLAKIAALVADAQSRRGPSEQWVEKFAAWYTPTILVGAIGIGLVPTAFGEPLEPWLYRGLVLLVIGCPCSLVISTPVTIVAAIASAARHGVLLKSGAFVEVPAGLRAIALDKTGTLTTGKPRVIEVVPLAEHDEKQLLERALAMEQRSTHPLARAIVEYATRAGITATPVTDLALIQGKGATGTFQGKPYWLGSHRLLEERKQETPEVHARIQQLEKEIGRAHV
jgi:Cd2+/Zn2+-exporting ATPase